MKQSKQTFLYFTRIIKMSDKNTTNKDAIMFMKNFEVHLSVKEFNQPLDKKEIRIGIKKDSSKKTTRQIQILIVFSQGVLKLINFLHVI